MRDLVDHIVLLRLCGRARITNETGCASVNCRLCNKKTDNFKREDN